MVISAQQAVPARTFPWCLRPGSRRLSHPLLSCPEHLTSSHRPPSFRDLASQGAQAESGGGWWVGKNHRLGVFLVKGECYAG